MWYMHEGFGWWAVFGGVWMILFWGSIIALIIWGISRWSKRSGSGGQAGKQTPLEIARERYARGEITKEQFDQIKKDLE